MTALVFRSPGQRISRTAEAQLAVHVRRCRHRPLASIASSVTLTSTSPSALPLFRHPQTLPRPSPIALQQQQGQRQQRQQQQVQRRCRTRAQAQASDSGGSSSGDSSLEAKLGRAASSLEARLGRAASSAASSFPYLLLAAVSLALAKPSLFLWFERHVTAALALTMATMGSTLTREDFEIVAAKPKRVALGALLQFTLMPLAGLAVSRLLCAASRADTVGICMVAACPGGVASNVVAFVARADVPLSVAMTATSTLAATVATPLIARLLLGAVVPVDGLALLRSTASVVLAPVVVGAGAAAAFPGFVKRLSPFAPLVAVVATVAVCGTVIARSSEVLLASLGSALGGIGVGGGASSTAAVGAASAGSRALPAAVLLHLLGFALGYFVSKFLCGLPEKQARTNSIEVGMQNSALGAVLVLSHFPALGAAAAAPCAVSACVHSLIGSALASYWSKRDPEAVDLARGEARVK